MAPRGYSEENISFAIVLTRNGDVVDVYDLRDHASRKPRPRSLRVPAPPADRSGKKRVSAFLWDNSKYALGVGRNRTELVLTPDQFEEFRRFHLEFLQSADDLELTALRSFVASWDPEKYETQFYVLGLSPNAARLAVRFFLQSTLGELIDCAGRLYRDLFIEPHSWTVPPALWRLLRETASQRDLDHVSPALAGEFARAVLTGGRYPRALLALTLLRIRADGVVNDLRAAICKACIVRDSRKSFEEEDVPVALDSNEPNPGYRLGRLFAILERAQYAALGDVNANIRDKYFGSASANPARVFPLLLRGTQDHLGKVRSKGGGGLAHWFDQQIAEVMSGLASSQPFPSTLRLEDQGRFAVGYYHQLKAGKTERQDIDELPETASQEN